MKPLLIAATLAAAVAAAAAVMPKYGVTVKVHEKADFAKFRTYAWTSGWSAVEPWADRMIVADIDRQLAALGLAKRDGEPCDVLVQYASLLRTDVDLRAKMSPVTKLRPEYPVGTLVILLLEPHGRSELFRGRIDLPIETEPAKFQAQFDRAIARVFAKYPRRHGHHDWP
jgi:hypothetical protein